MVSNDFMAARSWHRRPATMQRQACRTRCRREGRGRRHLQRHVWLASDEARYVTGVTLPVDAGFLSTVTDPSRPTRATRSRHPSSAAAASWTWCSPPSPPGGTSCWRARPARRSRRCCARSRRTGACRSCWWRATPSSRRRGWSATTTRPGCCARTTRPTTSCRPLVEAMRTGGFLYIEELNRAPEDTLNVLLAAMAEREVAVPRVGTIAAAADLPGAGVDEPVRQRRHGPDLGLGLRPLVPARRRLPGRRGGGAHRRARTGVHRRRAGRRRGRAHPGHPRPPELRRGSSVRGAIDLVALAVELEALGTYDGLRTPARARRRAARALRAGRAWTRRPRRRPETGDHRDLGEPFFLAPRRAAPGPHRLNIDNAVALPTADSGAPTAGAAARASPSSSTRRRRCSSSGTGPPVVVELGRRRAATATPTARRPAARASC